MRSLGGRACCRASRRDSGLAPREPRSTGSSFPSWWIKQGCVCMLCNSNIIASIRNASIGNSTAVTTHHIQQYQALATATALSTHVTLTIYIMYMLQCTHIMCHTSISHCTYMSYIVQLETLDRDPRSLFFLAFLILETLV